MEIKNCMLYFTEMERDIMAVAAKELSASANKIQRGKITLHTISENIRARLLDSGADYDKFSNTEIQAYASLSDFDINSDTIVGVSESEICKIKCDIDALVYFLNGAKTNNAYHAKVEPKEYIYRALTDKIFTQTGIWKLGCLTFIAFDFRDGKKEISAHHLVDIDGNAILKNYQLMEEYLIDFQGIEDTTEEEISVLSDSIQVLNTVREHVGEKLLVDIKGYAGVDKLMLLLHNHVSADVIKDRFKLGDWYLNCVEENTGKDMHSIYTYELGKEDEEIFNQILKNTMRVDAEAVCKELEIYFGNFYKYYLGIYYLHLILDRCEVSVLEYLKEAMNGRAVSNAEYSWLNYVVYYMREKSSGNDYYFPMLQGSCGLAFVHGEASLTSKEAIAVLLER